MEKEMNGYNNTTLYSLLNFCNIFSVDPCCAQPCENRGLCNSKGFDDYECECTRTGYYGKNCTTRK